MSPDTFDSLHAGDVVQGVDGQAWGVAEVRREPVFAVVLTRHGRRVTGYPHPAAAVAILSRSDVRAEYRAAEALDALGPVQLISETWQPS